MSNFAECTLIKLDPSEPHFVALTTFDIYHGRSTRFLLQKKDLEMLVNDPDATRILDTDIGSYRLCYCLLARDRFAQGFRFPYRRSNISSNLPFVYTSFQLFVVGQALP